MDEDQCTRNLIQSCLDRIKPKDVAKENGAGGNHQGDDGEGQDPLQGEEDDEDEWGYSEKEAFYALSLLLRIGREEDSAKERANRRWNVLNSGRLRELMRVVKQSPTVPALVPAVREPLDRACRVKGSAKVYAGPLEDRRGDWDDGHVEDVGYAERIADPDEENPDQENSDRGDADRGDADQDDADQDDPDGSDDYDSYANEEVGERTLVALLKELGVDCILPSEKNGEKLRNAMARAMRRSHWGEHTRSTMQWGSKLLVALVSQLEIEVSVGAFLSGSPAAVNIVCDKRCFINRLRRA
jgi:hypothetical protein